MERQRLLASLTCASDLDKTPRRNRNAIPLNVDERSSSQRANEIQAVGNSVAAAQTNKMQSQQHPVFTPADQVCRIRPNDAVALRFDVLRPSLNLTKHCTGIVPWRPVEFFFPDRLDPLHFDTFLRVSWIEDMITQAAAIRMDEMAEYPASASNLFVACYWFGAVSLFFRSIRHAHNYAIGIPCPCPLRSWFHELIVLLLLVYLQISWYVCLDA